MHLEQPLKGWWTGLEELKNGGGKKPSKLQPCWGRPEYWEESWRIDETCCPSDSSESSLTNGSVKNLLSLI